LILLKAAQLKRRDRFGSVGISILIYFNLNPTKLQFESILAQNCLLAITRPTRVTSHSATLISHILVENGAKTQIPGFIISALADHYPTFLITPGTTRGAMSLPYYRKEFTEERYSAFKNLLKSSSWETVTNENDRKT
jgi:hypothetical protein